MSLPSLETVKVKDINLHPDIPPQLRKTWASTVYLLEGERILCPDAILLLLTLYPPLLCGSKKRNYCFAGLRSWQLAKACLPADQEIAIIQHGKAKDLDIPRIALLDLYLTTLIRGLEFQTWNSSPDPAPWQHTMSTSLLAKISVPKQAGLQQTKELPSTGTMRLQKLAADKISFHHQAVSTATRQMSPYLHSLLISPAALKIYNMCHPIHVVKTADKEHPFTCFAGQKPLLLHQKIKTPPQKLQVCLHGPKAKQQLDDLAACNASLSPFFFALGNRWKQDLFRLWQQTGKRLPHKKIVKGLGSKAALARTLHFSRNAFSESATPPESSLIKLLSHARA